MVYILQFFAGFGVSKKKHKRGVVGIQHKITKEESMKWFQQKVRSGVRAYDHWALFDLPEIRKHWQKIYP